MSGFGDLEFDAVDITKEAGESPQEKADFERRQAERAAAKEREYEAAVRKREAQERPIKAACSAAYRSTIDKLQRDLTVRETKMVEYCTLMDWYHP